MSGGEPAVLDPQSGNLNFVGELNLKFLSDIFEGLRGDFGPFLVLSVSEEKRSPFAIDLRAERSLFPAESRSNLSSVLSNLYDGSDSLIGEPFSGISLSSSAQSLFSCRLAYPFVISGVTGVFSGGFRSDFR